MRIACDTIEYMNVADVLTSFHLAYAASRSRRRASLSVASILLNAEAIHDFDLALLQLNLSNFAS